MYGGVWLYLQMVASWFQEFNDEQKNILILQLLVGVCNCLYFKSFVTDGCILKLKKLSRSHLESSYFSAANSCICMKLIMLYDEIKFVKRAERQDEEVSGDDEEVDEAKWEEGVEAKWEEGIEDWKRKGKVGHVAVSVS